MFRSDLEKKLKTVFGVEKVIYDQFSLGKEIDALFCDIDEARVYTPQGGRSFIVTGRLTLCGYAGKNQYGWIHNRIELAKKADIAELWLGRNETPVKFSHNNGDYVKYDVDFIYRWAGQYNAEQEKIETYK